MNVAFFERLEMNCERENSSFGRYTIKARLVGFRWEVSNIRGGRLVEFGASVCSLSNKQMFEIPDFPSRRFFGMDEERVNDWFIQLGRILREASAPTSSKATHDGPLMALLRTVWIFLRMDDVTDSLLSALENKNSELGSPCESRETKAALVQAFADRIVYKNRSSIKKRMQNFRARAPKPRNRRSLPPSKAKLFRYNDRGEKDRSNRARSLEPPPDRMNAFSTSPDLAFGMATTKSASHLASIPRHNEGTTEQISFKSVRRAEPCSCNSTASSYFDVDVDDFRQLSALTNQCEFSPPTPSSLLLRKRPAGVAEARKRPPVVLIENLSPPSSPLWSRADEVFIEVI